MMQRIGLQPLCWVVLALAFAQHETKAQDETFSVKYSQGPEACEIVASAIPDSMIEAMKAKPDDAFVMKVYLWAGDSLSKTALLGRVRIREGQVVFEPRFPLVPGSRYRVAYLESDAKFDLRELESRTRGQKARGVVAWADLEIEALPESPAGHVVGVFPSSEIVPENLLKFYVQFSEPMGLGQLYQKTRIVDAQGNPVPAAFLEIAEELWNREGDRVTLLFDPGRIKRELRPNMEIGSPLRAGKEYSLVIDATWTDSKGREIREGFRKSFRVAAHDDVCPNPDSWQLTEPTAGTRQELIIEFAESLDRAMLEHSIRVFDQEGVRLEGQVNVSNEEMQWSFEPKSAWEAGDYFFEVDTDLEDRAGNSIHKPFEVDLTQPFRSPYPEATVRLPFSVKASPR